MSAKAKEKAKRKLAGRIGPEASANGHAKPPAAEEPKPARPTPPPTYRPFPIETLPRLLRDFAVRGAQDIDCDPAFIVLPALAVAGSMVGPSRRIQLKGRWNEAPIIWAVTVAEASSAKSIGFELATSCLEELQEEYDRRLASHPRRMYTSDGTIEKVWEMFHFQPGSGLLYAADELSAWFDSFCRYKSNGGSDCARWLEFWRPVNKRIDRKVSEPRTLILRNACLSITGGIQPGVLAQIFAGDGLFDAGGPYRLLYAMPPLRQTMWNENEMPSAILRRWADCCRRLMFLENERVLRMTPQAKDVWIAFYNASGEREYVDHPLTRASHAKLRSYAARLALLRHLIDDEAMDAGEISREEMEAGITLANWFALESERVIFSRGETRDRRELRNLAEQIDRIPGRRVTVRDFHNSHSRRYKTAPEARAALEELAAAGFGFMGEHLGRPYFQRVDGADETPAESPDRSGILPMRPDKSATVLPSEVLGELERLAGDLAGQLEEPSAHDSPTIRPQNAPDPPFAVKIEAPWARLGTAETVEGLTDLGARIDGLTDLYVETFPAEILSPVGPARIDGLADLYVETTTAVQLQVVGALARSQAEPRVCGNCSIEDLPGIEWSNAALCKLCADAAEANILRLVAQPPAADASGPGVQARHELGDRPPAVTSPLPITPWRRVPIAALNVSAAIKDTLLAHPNRIATLGDLDRLVALERLGDTVIAALASELGLSRKRATLLWRACVTVVHPATGQVAEA